MTDDTLAPGPEVHSALPTVHAPNPDEITPEGVRVMLRPEDRKRLLGRLAEFELQLLNLTPNQQAFVMAYIMDPTDATAAARVAGYSERRAAATASELLKRPHIAACVALGEQLREDRTMITSDRTLHELAIIGFSDITDFEFRGGKISTRPGIPEYATRAISSIEYTETEFMDEKGNPRTTYKTKIRLWPKDRALHMISIYQNLLTGTNVTINQNNTVNNDNRGQVHQHQHQSWKIGDLTLQF